MKYRVWFLMVFAAALAVGQATHTATVTWIAPTTNTDGSPITATLTYNLYQGAQGAALALKTSAIAALSTTVTTGLTAGTTQCFAVTAVANGLESAQSNSACAAVPFPTPGIPSQITVVVH
jgi:hypothetical protein